MKLISNQGKAQQSFNGTYVKEQGVVTLPSHNHGSVGIWVYLKNISFLFMQRVIFRLNHDGRKGRCPRNASRLPNKYGLIRGLFRDNDV